MKKRVFSGMRPTGRLHLGHLAGALSNWIRFQDEYDCFYCIVDWHAMMSDYSDTRFMKDNCREVLLDWLGVGLDPDRSTLFLQSHVPHHAELHLALSMITPLGWLERCPTYKDQKMCIRDRPMAVCRFRNRPGDGPAVAVHYPSGSGEVRTMFMGTRFLTSGKRALIIDDFMRGGSTAAGMLLVAKEFGAQVIGIGIFIAASEPEKKAVSEYRSLLRLERGPDGTPVVKVRR